MTIRKTPKPGDEHDSPLEELEHAAGPCAEATVVLRRRGSGPPFSSAGRPNGNSNGNGNGHGFWIKAMTIPILTVILNAGVVIGMGTLAMRYNEQDHERIYGRIDSTVGTLGSRVDNSVQELNKKVDQWSLAVDRIDRSGTTRGQPIYTDVAELKRQYAHLEKQVGELDMKMNWIINSQEVMMRERGISPPTPPAH